MSHEESAPEPSKRRSTPPSRRWASSRTRSSTRCSRSREAALRRSGRARGVRVWLRPRRGAGGARSSRRGDRGRRAEPEPEGDRSPSVPAECAELTRRGVRPGRGRRGRGDPEILDAFGIESQHRRVRGRRGRGHPGHRRRRARHPHRTPRQVARGLQTLVAAIANSKLGQRYPVMVDVEGYRAAGGRSSRRWRVRPRSGQAAEAERQAAADERYERKVVHVALRNDRGS